MENIETDMGRNGNGVAALIIRGIGVSIMGAAIATTGWMYWKFEDAAKEQAELRENLARVETSVEKFHDESYRWRERHEKIDDKQWEAIQNKK